MRKGDNVRLRKDGRYEARYIKYRNADGSLKYGYCYGKTYEEAVENRDYQMRQWNSAKKRKMNLLILGAGAQGGEVYDVAYNLRIFSKIAFLDDNPLIENTIGKWSDAKRLVDEYPIAIVAVADRAIRKAWMEKLEDYGFIIPTLVHPTAYVPDGVSIGYGSVIAARTTVAPGVSIGVGCVVTSGSTIQKKAVIPDWSYYLFDKNIEDYHEEYQICSE